MKISLSIFFVSLVIWSANFYINHQKNKVITNGVYIEGVVGSPRIINPLYNGLNEAENDITHLVYSSLFKRNPNGELNFDLIDKLEETPDGKTYTITLRSGVKWQNYQDLNSPEVTADDVVFTFNAIKNPLYKSTLQTVFINTEIEKIEDDNNNKFKFTLATPYAGFKELLTFGILPAEIWQQVDPADVARAEASNKPVGSGPYQFNTLSKSANGRIQEYNLTPNSAYYKQVPFLGLKFKFFQSIDEAVADFQQGKIDGLGDLPIEYLLQNEISNDKYNVRALNYPKSTALFFNLADANLLSDKTIRKAINLVINKNKIIPAKLSSYTQIINSPIDSNSFAYDKDLKNPVIDTNQAAALLDKNNWKIKTYTKDDITKATAKLTSAKENEKEELNKIIELGEGNWRTKDGSPLIINLATINRPAILAMTDEISKQLAVIGIKVKVSAYDSSEINDVIKSKSFDALLYSIVQGADPDPYIFWHSTQIDNGLNITSFNNKDVDKLLEEARQTNNKEQRIAKYKKFQEIINEEIPAIFLFSSKYIYIQDKKINGQKTTNIIQPSDRLNDAAEWFLKTSKTINWKNN